MHVTPRLSLLGALLPPCALALPFLGAPEPELAERILARLESEIAAKYAYKDSGQWLAESLDRNRRLGEYDGLEGGALGEALTADLRGWTADKHFLVAHMPDWAAQIEAEAERPPSDAPPKDDPGEAAVNFGVRRAEMLDERVGLIRLDRIAFSPGTVGAFQEALGSLPDAQALVLDLRDNHGGGGDTLPGLLTCFFPKGERVVLATKYWRPDDEHTPIETLPELEGPCFDGPLLVLTSKNTRSAAEALAYHLRAFGRAFVVGEPSSGGAHPADMVSLGDGFVALIPMGIVTSARTGTDWEGKGVPVDAPCAAGQAEERARELALRLLALDR